MMDREQCMCGDPDCGNCFPSFYAEEDPDEAYDRERQAEIDEGRDRHAR